MVALASDTVNTALMVAGPEILIESCPVAAVESVLLPVLVAEMVDLTAGLGVSVVPVSVATAAVEASVSLVDRDGESLHSLGLVRFLLQQDGAGWSRGVVRGGGGGGGGSRAVGASREGHGRGSNRRAGGLGGHLGHLGHVSHVSHVGLRVVLGVKLQCGDEAGVVLAHVVSQHVVGQLGGHGRHHLLHLDTLGHPQAGRVDHVQLCSQVGRLWHLPSLGWFYILTVNFLWQGISLVLTIITWVSHTVIVIVS